MKNNFTQINGFLKFDLPFSIKCTVLNLAVLLFLFNFHIDEVDDFFLKIGSFIPAVKIALKHGGVEVASITSASWVLFLIEVSLWARVRFRAFEFRLVRFDFVSLVLFFFSAFNFVFYGDIFGHFIPFGRSSFSIYEDAVRNRFSAAMGGGLIVGLSMSAIFYSITFISNRNGDGK